MTTTTLKGRDVSPTGVRLPPELRQQLQREAAVHGRSLSQEITQRLIESLRVQNNQRKPSQAPGARQAGDAPAMACEPPPSYGAEPFTDQQRMLLAAFSSMAPDKQLALLTMLRK